jgi:sensor histidine kinase YesM
MGVVKQSFKRQIFVVLMAVTLTMVIAGGILTIQGFQARLKADYIKKDLEQNTIINHELQDSLEAASKTLIAISDNDIITGELKSHKFHSQIIYSEIYNSSEAVRDFATIDIYRNNTCVFSTDTKNLHTEMPDNYLVLREVENSKGKVVYTFDPTKTSESGAVLLVAKQIVYGDPNGFAVIRINRNEMESMLRDNINAKDGFMLTDRFLRPFCLIGSAENGAELSMIRSNLFNGLMYNENMDNNVYMDEIGDTGLLSIYVTPPTFGETAAQVSYQIVVIEAIISVILCLLVSSRLSGHFSKPINTLSAGMERFRKGDFDAKIELGREDEFENLAVGFNKMTTQLKQTMEDRVKAEHTINETRIQMMQAQLNPHFLYNTLDTIKWVGKANNVPEVATMSASLAGILRTSISERQFCKLEKELELVQNYCEIQKIRFDDRFDITIDVPIELMDAVIPKLILQPIVENAIIHGMDEAENGHIYVAAVREMKDGKDLLKISVQDDGKGISDEMMQALNNDDVETLKGHLGLNNVNTIIRLYYGKEYGIMAFRPTAGGTVMIVTLPYSEDEPENTDHNDNGEPQ